MEKDLIYDIGMHNGDDSAYYLSQGFKVIAIDAAPELIKEGQLRFKNDIIENRLEILNLGIALEEGYFDFYLNKLNSVWNSFDKSIGTREGADYEIIKVKTKSIDEIVKEKGIPYYMKIDIEGNDILCLTSLQNCVEKPKYISLEVNSIHLVFKLAELGYTKFKIIDQQCFLPLEIPTLKEYKIYRWHTEFQQSLNIFIRVIRKLFGKTINKLFERNYKHLFTYNHPFGSSGPFGENLPGRWLDFEEALKVYLHYKAQHEKSKRNSGYNYWIDIHATN